MYVIGAVVAKYSGEHLHDVIFESKYFKEGNIREALRSGYLAMDDALRKGILYIYISRGAGWMRMAFAKG